MGGIEAYATLHVTSLLLDGLVLSTGELLHGCQSGGTIISLAISRRVGLTLPLSWRSFPECSSARMPGVSVSEPDRTQISIAEALQKVFQEEKASVNRGLEKEEAASLNREEQVKARCY